MSLFTIEAKVEVHIHDGADAEQLNRIEAAILAVQAAITQEGIIMTQEFDNLTTEVTSIKTVEQSAVTLLQGLSAQIASLKNDPVALQALADSLHATSADLAAAVLANTPVVA